MKLIKLTQGQFTKVDDEDFEKLGALKWHAVWNQSGKRFYAVRKIMVDGKKKQQYLHRKILGLVDSKLMGDHINHDALDNQRHNLRACTHQQNQWNRKGPNRDSQSGVRGVYWDKSNKNWRARITINGRKHFLGCFQDKMAAASAYDKANKKYFGEFGGGL